MLNMNYTLHKLPEGFVITSDEIIKEGDEVIHIGNPSFTFNESMRKFLCEDCKKIIAQQDQIDFSALSEEDQKKIGLNNYDFSKMFYDILKATYPEFDEWVEAKEYKKAQELLSDRRFTLEDMLGLLEVCKESAVIGTTVFIERKAKEYIESLSQKSWNIEIELDWYMPQSNGKISDGKITHEKALDPKYNTLAIPKLTNNKIKILKIL
jgi:alpha-galactosidase/6-phospho-beta-glucosidase family protein